MSWVNKIEQDFADLVDYMNQYKDSSAPGYKGYYISSAIVSDYSKLLPC